MDIFDYFQLLFLFLFIFISGWKTVKMRRKKIRVWLIEVSYPFFLLVWFSLIILHIFRMEKSLPLMTVYFFYKSVLLRSVGLFCNFLALYLNISGLNTLGENWRVGVDTDNPGILIQEGIYRFTRNPIMNSFFCYSLSVWLTYPNVFMSIALMIVVATIHYQVLKEETFLENYYGKSYTDYKKQVGRYVTIWRKN